MIKFKDEKTKILTVFLMILVMIYVLIIILSKTYASYESEGDLNFDISNALYIFEEGKLSFNLDLEKIVPSDEAYVYSFTISNYNNIRRSDVDIEYKLSLLTTTNLPLEYELYYNEEYKKEDSKNIIDSNEYKTDIDGSWYKVMKVLDIYTFNHKKNETHTFYLVIYFPKDYSKTLGYEGLTDNIEIIIESKQIIKE